MLTLQKYRNDATVQEKINKLKVEVAKQKLPFFMADDVEPENVHVES